MVPGSDSITSAVARRGNQQKKIKSVERGSECEILSHIFFLPEAAAAASVRSSLVELSSFMTRGACVRVDSFVQERTSERLEGLSPGFARKPTPLKIFALSGISKRSKTTKRRGVWKFMPARICRILKVRPQAA